MQNFLRWQSKTLPDLPLFSHWPLKVPAFLNCSNIEKNCHHVLQLPVWHLFAGYNVKAKHELISGVIGTFEGEDDCRRPKYINKAFFH